MALTKSDLIVILFTEAMLLGKYNRLWLMIVYIYETRLIFFCNSIFLKKIFQKTLFIDDYFTNIDVNISFIDLSIVAF